MRMDMLPVDVCCHHTLVFSEGFLRKLHRNPMCKFGWSTITFWKTLHQMIVHPTTVLVIRIFGCEHFYVSGSSIAVQSRYILFVL